MAAWDEAVSNLERRLENLEWRDGGEKGVGVCSADRPHVDGLVYMRGPNEYHCHCRQVYVKDGAGGLKEVA